MRKCFAEDIAPAASEIMFSLADEKRSCCVAAFVEESWVVVKVVEVGCWMLVPSFSALPARLPISRCASCIKWN